MRVLHLTTEFPPVIYGGLGTAVGGWATACARAGVEIAVQLVGGVLALDGAAALYGAPRRWRSIWRTVRARCGGRTRMQILIRTQRGRGACAAFQRVRLKRSLLARCGLGGASIEDGGYLAGKGSALFPLNRVYGVTGFRLWDEVLTQVFRAMSELPVDPCPQFRH